MNFGDRVKVLVAPFEDELGTVVDTNGRGFDMPIEVRLDDYTPPKFIQAITGGLESVCFKAVELEVLDA